MASTRQDWRVAYDTQLDLLRWVKSETGGGWMQWKLGNTAWEYNPRSQVLIAAMFDMEASRLTAATPYFVSHDMCDLVESAASSFHPEPIYPTDVLSMSGFVYFERPFTIPDRFDRPTNIAAFSWHPITVGPDGDYLDPTRFLTREDEFREALEERHAAGKVDGLGICIYENEQHAEWPEGRPKPPIFPLHLTPWWWGLSFDGNEWTEEGRPTGAQWWWQVLQVTLRLMQQRITVIHQERPDRPTRRYAKRLNLNADRDVCVVTLRRERSPEHGEPMSEHHYSHRFIVGGHWRNQPYKGGVYRQIWIADYEKGPEGAPLIIKPRVYRWTR